MFKAHRLLYHSTLGSSVIQKKKKETHLGGCGQNASRRGAGGGDGEDNFEGGAKAHVEGCRCHRAKPCVEGGEREFLIDNLRVKIHSIIEIVLVDRPCAMGF